jgi:hypothetical protein
MPLARYFLFVGGALIVLLFGLNAYMPSPVVASPPAESVDRPVVRIHSAQKLPERIVIDTSIPTIVPPPVVVAAAAVPAKTPALDALAQVAPPELKKSDLKKPEPAVPPKRKVVARRQVHQPMLAYGQPPQQMVGFAQPPRVAFAPRFAFAQGPRFDFFGHN